MQSVSTNSQIDKARRRLFGQAVLGEIAFLDM